MNNKAILSSAPEGWTHVAKKRHGNRWLKLTDDTDWFDWENPEGDFNFYWVSCRNEMLRECESIRSRTDIDRIVELESENEKLKMLLEIANAGIEFSTAQTKLVGELGSVWKEKNQIKCLWDTLSYEDRNKPMGLSCNCPKCSVTC